MSEVNSINLENWRPVVGFEGIYSVSNLGRVQCDHLKQGGRWHRHLLKSKVANQTGYLSVGLFREGHSSTKYIHRLVLEAFVGPCPKGMECCHNDGDRTNPRLDNLRWDTRSGNQADRIRHGTGLIGKKRPDFRMRSQAELDHVVTLIASGLSVKDISLATGMSRAQVHRLANGTCRTKIAVATHCPAGHEYTGANTGYKMTQGKLRRRCKTCHRMEYRRKSLQNTLFLEPQECP